MLFLQIISFVTIAYTIELTIIRYSLNSRMIIRDVMSIDSVNKIIKEKFYRCSLQLTYMDEYLVE